MIKPNNNSTDNNITTKYIFFPRFMQVLSIFIMLKKNKLTVTEIYKKINNNNNIISTNNITYSHTYNIIKDLSELNIVTTYKKGRLRHVLLTEKGIVLSKLCNQIINNIK